MIGAADTTADLLHIYDNKGIEIRTIPLPYKPYGLCVFNENLLVTGKLNSTLNVYDREFNLLYTRGLTHTTRDTTANRVTYMVADDGGNAIKVYNDNGVLLDSHPLAYSPSGMGIINNNIYVGSWASQSIYTYDMEGVNIRAYIVGYDPGGITSDNEDVVVSDPSNQKIHWYNKEMNKIHEMAVGYCIGGITSLYRED